MDVRLCDLAVFCFMALLLSQRITFLNGYSGKIVSFFGFLVKYSEMFNEIAETNACEFIPNMKLTQQQLNRPLKDPKHWVEDLFPNGFYEALTTK